MAKYLDEKGLEAYNNQVKTHYYNPNRSDIDSILNGDLPLVSPVLTKNSWGCNAYPGIAAVDSTNTTVTVPTGVTVTYLGSYKWTSTNGYKNPTSVTGTWGATLPASGVEKDLDLSSKQSKSQNTPGDVTIASVTLSAPKKGLMVNGSKVIKASGSDSTTASAIVRFRDNLYYGPITKQTGITSADINTLTAALVASKVQTVTATTTSTQYFCYAYPKSYGALSTIIADGADPILDNFKAPLTVSVTNKGGYAQDYYVYVSAFKGAFSGNSLQFK